MTIKNFKLHENPILSLVDKLDDDPIQQLENNLRVDKIGDEERVIQPGRCVDFLGTNEYVEVPDHADFSFTDGSDNDEPFSVSAWINTDDTTVVPFVSKYLDPYEWEFRVSISSTLELVLYDDSASQWVSRRASTVISSATWYHCCATYDGSNSPDGIKLYLNGVRDDTTSYYSGGTYVGMENTSTPFAIGRYDTIYANGRYFDARVYNKELAQSEIKSIMEGRANGSEVGWWKLDEGGGEYCFDSSGKGHDGEVKNATLSTFWVTDATLPFSFQNDVGYSNCYWFDGANNDFALDSGNSQDLDPGTGYCTIEGWFRINSTPDETWMVCAKSSTAGSGTTGWYVGVNTSENLIFATPDNGSVWSVGTGNNTIIPGQWHYFAAWRHEGGASIEEDIVDNWGTQKKSKGNDIDSSYNFRIGSNGLGTSSDFDGYIKSIRYSNVARTADERKYSYNHGFTIDDNVVALWEFDDGNLQSAVNDDNENDHNLTESATSPYLVYLPRDESNPSKDITGGSLQFNGRVKYNAELSSNCPDFDGVNDRVQWDGQDIVNHTVWSAAFRFDDYTKVALAFVLGGYGNKNLLLYSSGGGIGMRDSSGSYFNWDVATSEIISKYSTLVFYSDGTYVGLIVDGIYRGYITPTSTLIQVNQFVIGYTAADTYPCDGQYWDLRIWHSNIGREEAEKYHNDEMTVMPDHWFPMSEGQGIIINDIVGDKNGRLQNVTLSTAWDQTQERFHYNMTRGFSDALYFNNIDARCSLSGEGSDFDPGTDDFSIVAWVCSLDYTGTTQFIFTNYTDGNNRFNFHITTSGVLIIRGYEASTQKVYAENTSGTLTNRKWHHVAVAVDRGNSVKMFIDGIEVTVSVTTNLATELSPSGTIYIGTYDATGNWFDGNIAEVSYHDKALSSEEVLDIYTNGVTIDDNTVAYWNFKNGLGIDSVYPDESKHVLTLTNTEHVRIPADAEDLTKDVTGRSIQHLAGNWHNNAETEIDFTGGVASPAMNISDGYTDFNGTTGYIAVPHTMTEDNLKVRGIDGIGAWVFDQTYYDSFDDSHEIVYDLASGNTVTNLIVNGTEFNDDTTDFQPDNWVDVGHPLTWFIGIDSDGFQGRYLQVTENNVSDSAIFRNTGMTGLTTGNFYKFSCLYRCTEQFELRYNSGASIKNFGTNTGDATYVEHYFYHSGASTDLYIGTVNGDPGDWVEVDQVELWDFGDSHSLLMSGWTSYSNLMSSLVKNSPINPGGQSLLFNGTDQYLYIPDGYGDDFDPGTGDFSFTAWVKRDDYTTTTNVIFGNYTDASNRWNVNIQDDGQIRVIGLEASTTIVSADSSSNPFTDGQWHHMAVCVDRGTTIKMYVDGEEIDVTIATNSASDLSPGGLITIGIYGDESSYPFDGSLAELRYFDRYLTANEVKYYAGYSNNLSFGDGVTDSPFSVAAWVNMDDATGFHIVSKGDYNIDAQWRLSADGIDKLAINTFDESVSACYIGRTYSTALTIYEGEWIHVAGTYDGSSANSGFKLYLNGSQIDDTDLSSNPGSYVAMELLTDNFHIGEYATNYANGRIRDVRVYSAELDSDEIQQIYLGYELRENLVSYWPLAGNSLDYHGTNHGTAVGGTTFTEYTVPTAHAFEDKAENPLFKKIRETDAEIECTSDGTMYIKSDQVYGMWEFDFYKTDASSFFLSFISDLTDYLGGICSMAGYEIVIATNETFYLKKRASEDPSPTVLFSTASGYIDTSQWLNLKIYRNSITDEYVAGAVGTFGVFLNNTLMTADTGTNPVTDNTYTVSNYFVIEINNGDKVKDIKINDTSINLSKFTIGTGTYTITGERNSNFVLAPKGVIKNVDLKDIYKYTKTEDIT
ncbi:MAG: LamG-like jellyroll fold domain-containing protein [Candidatus Heimdallarchaeaceae archaeon]|jgi:hypothetical protein